MIFIDVGKQFSRFPSGRYAKNGSTSGETFRAQFLVPALTGSGSPISIALDGTVGYGSSFLEEAFGGLVRLGFQPADLLSRLKLETADSSLKTEIKEYIASASAA